MPTVYGTPNAARDNIVVICHALTGNSKVAEWWPAIVGRDALFDTERWCVVGVDICHPERNEVKSRDLHDVVLAQRQAVDELGFERIRFVVGGSLGGMQALQWALDAPERVDHAIVIGAHDHHTAMGIAFNALQREAVTLDHIEGLGLARKIAMLTYKSEALFAQRHGRRRDRNDTTRFDIEGYLDHQGDKFIARMDPKTYVERTHLMDSFDVRERASQNHASITFVGITSDWLFRAEDIRAAAERFDAEYLELKSDHGHDAFLAEPEKLKDLLQHVVQPKGRTTRAAVRAGTYYSMTVA